MSWQIYISYKDARSFFRDIPRVIAMMDEARLIADYGVAAFGQSGGGGANSSPTESMGIYLAMHQNSVIHQARQRVEECEEVIGTALQVVHAVRHGLGKKYADALDLHYIDCMSTSNAAETMEISARTLNRYIETACDWCDYKGVHLFDKMT